MADCKTPIAVLLILLGITIPISAGAVTIEAARVHGEIPVNPSDVFWSNYGPT